MGEKMALMGLRYQRNRLAGNLQQLELSNAQALRRIERLQQGIADRNEKILQLNGSITVLGETAHAIFPDKIGPLTARKTYQKRHVAEWGGIKKTTLQVLKDSAGTPVTTFDVAERIATENDLCLSGEQRSRLLRSVCDVFGKLRKSGIATRVSAPTCPGDSSSWVLSASIE